MNLAKNGPTHIKKNEISCLEFGRTLCRIRCVKSCLTSIHDVLMDLEASLPPSLSSLHDRREGWLLFISFIDFCPKLCFKIIKQSICLLMVLETILTFSRGFPMTEKCEKDKQSPKHSVCTVFTSEHKIEFGMKLMHDRPSIGPTRLH